MPGPHSYHHSTADETVKTGPGVLYSVHLAAGTGALATATVYDNTAASGTVIARLAAVADGNDRWEAPGGASFGAGIHVDLTGAGGTADFVFD